jgi:aspartate carbamoyltransferase catalytic subunit
VREVKHLLGIDRMERADIVRVLDRASEFGRFIGASGKDKERVQSKALAGKRVLNLFFETSTRTRFSFERAARNLSAEVTNFTASGSSVEKGESIKDTVRTLGALDPDVIAVRSAYSGVPERIAEWVGASVVNAGDGKHQHPTQALLDIYTLRQRFDSLEGLNLWIVGDVLHSRVARSLIQAATKMGAKVTLSGPPSLIPRGVEEAFDCQVEDTLERLGEADVVYVLRLQKERITDSLLPSLSGYTAEYQINLERLTPSQLVMHPGPINRGVEIAADVADSPQSLIEEQVRAGIAVRMAVLCEAAGV